MDITSSSGAVSKTTTPEIQQAMLMKRQLERQQVQTQQLIESARTSAPDESNTSDPRVGRYLDSKA